MKDILYPGILAVMCWEIETLPCEGLSWHGYTILTSRHNPIQSVSREIGFLPQGQILIVNLTSSSSSTETIVGSQAVVLKELIGATIKERMGAWEF